MTEAEHSSNFLFWENILCLEQQEIRDFFLNKLFWPNYFAFSISDAMNAEYYVYIHTFLLAV